MNSIRQMLARTKTITFDCYGTLIDWDAGLARSFVDVFGPIVSVRRSELFDTYVRAEAEIEAGPYCSYRDVLAAALERVAKRFAWEVPPGKHDRLAELLPTWIPFTDTNAALHRLKARFRLGVLSNIDRDLFAGTTRHFPIEFDFVVTAQDVRGYKPNLAHFEQCIAEQGGREGWLHVAQSQFHDGRPANQLGIAFVWINRYNDPVDGSVVSNAVFPDLRSLAVAAGC